MLDVKSLIHSDKEYEYLFFWGHTESPGDITKACLSQWYPSSFFEDGKFYNCAEQYMMAHKARLIGDRVTEDAIMNETDPKKIKALGKKVKPFDSELWNKHKVDIVERGNKLKFSQNILLGMFLDSTGDKVLVEASPYDDIWGIGLAETESVVTNPKMWRGQNLLGFALMEVREQLRQEEEMAKLGIQCGVTPEKVIHIKANEIFVFGSDLFGNHSGGSSALAVKQFGAVKGIGVGMQGKSYAIPTHQVSRDVLQHYVDQFIQYAKLDEGHNFLVTRIGCGKAGLKVQDVAPLFAKALSMKNVSLPQEFIDIISPQSDNSKAEAHKIASMWSLGLGNSAKAFMGENPMPVKKEIATAQTWETIRPMPQRHATVTLNYTIPTWSMDIVRYGHIPDAMEDHWFMYCDETTIRYYRSWTGICVYVAHYEIKGDMTVITTLEINRDEGQYSETDNKKDVLIFLYLLTAEYGGDASKFWNMIFKG